MGDFTFLNYTNSNKSLKASQIMESQSCGIYLKRNELGSVLFFQTTFMSTILNHLRDDFQHLI